MVYVISLNSSIPRGIIQISEGRKEQVRMLSNLYELYESTVADARVSRQMKVMEGTTWNRNIRKII